MRARNVHCRFSGKNPVFPKWALMWYFRGLLAQNGPSNRVISILLEQGVYNPTISYNLLQFHFCPTIYYNFLQFCDFCLKVLQCPTICQLQPKNVFSSILSQIELLGFKIFACGTILINLIYHIQVLFHLNYAREKGAPLLILKPVISFLFESFILTQSYNIGHNIWQNLAHLSPLLHVQC